MEQTFEDILSSLLDSYEKSESKDIDALLREKSEELGLTEESIALVKDASEYIDKFAEKTNQLAEAQDDGISRKRWLTSDIEKSLGDYADEEKAEIMQAVSEQVDMVINQQAGEE